MTLELTQFSYEPRLLHAAGEVSNLASEEAA